MGAKSGQSGILAIFKYLDHLTNAMERIGEKPEFSGHEVYSPTSYHEIEHAAKFSPSPVRFFTLIGGLTGTFTGFFLCLLMDWDWRITVGGKQGGIYSLPAYVVIGFELTILLGALSTILGVLWHCRIPNPKARVLDPRLTDDRFGIYVPNASLDSAQAKLLKEMGAEEVRSC